MCELIFVNTGDVNFNKILLLHSLQIDSVANGDGTGFFNTCLYKTKLKAGLITNLGHLINTFVTSPAPVIGHVRLSSTAYKNTVSDAKAHPFETKHFIFAHNGTLELKDSADVVNYKDKMDTEIFLDKLEKIYVEKNKDIILALQESMKLFTGKFAFMIFEKETLKYWVCRGETATLFKRNITVNGNKVGFIVNTLELDLDKILFQAKNVIESLHSIKFEYDSKGELLESNSIFLLENGELVKKEVLTENKKPVQEYARGHFYRGEYLYTQEELEDAEFQGGGVVKSVYANYFGDEIRVILDFMKKYSIDSICDMENLFYAQYGHGFLDGVEKEFKEFSYTLTKISQMRNNPQIIEIWRFLKKVYRIAPVVYKTFPNISYPYLLSETQTLVSAMNKAKLYLEEKERKEDESPV